MMMPGIGELFPNSHQAGRDHNQHVGNHPVPIDVHILKTSRVFLVNWQQQQQKLIKNEKWKRVWQQQRQQTTTTQYRFTYGSAGHSSLMKKTYKLQNSKKINKKDEIKANKNHTPLTYIHSFASNHYYQQQNNSWKQKQTLKQKEKQTCE